MKVKFGLKTFFLMIIAVSSCGRKESEVSFANVCHEKNQTKVQMKGFLMIPQTATPNLPQKNLLLVENDNGTGGFIKIEFDDPMIEKANQQVKILGKVSKNENECVLKVEKIETP